MKPSDTLSERELRATKRALKKFCQAREIIDMVPEDKDLPEYLSHGEQSVVTLVIRWLTDYADHIGIDI